MKAASEKVETGCLLIMTDGQSVGDWEVVERYRKEVHM